VSSVSNGLYFLTLPLVSVMIVIYRKMWCALSIHQKECRKSLGCALYIRCALSIEKYGTICINQRQLRFLLFRSVTQHRLVLGYWSFGAGYRSLLQGTAWLLKTGTVSYTKTSISNYHSTLYNISEQQRPCLQHGRSPRSHTGSCFAVQRIKLLLPVAYMAMKIPLWSSGVWHRVVW